MKIEHIFIFFKKFTNLQNAVFKLAVSIFSFVISKLYMKYTFNFFLFDFLKMSKDVFAMKIYRHWELELKLVINQIDFCSAKFWKRRQ